MCQLRTYKQKSHISTTAFNAKLLMSLRGKMVKLAKYESIRILTPRELEMWNVITLQVDDKYESIRILTPRELEMWNLNGENTDSVGIHVADINISFSQTVSDLLANEILLNRSSQRQRYWRKFSEKDEFKFDRLGLVSCVNPRG
ncbi:hypothetical protein QE152_g34060 [Popillia japonica]|uniref:Uncharacterized protein n=1 Tax=Popillia japonica TaxID=7064 RepID=A0AAW1IV88_POPJA